MPAPQSPAAFDFQDAVERAYTRLTAKTSADADAGLGGKLFYAGEMDEEGRALVAAANIAGAATLAATADRAAQKQVIRDGITDFLVTSLDEALRILKNQLRKRESAAVCVGLAPEVMEREMDERGVVPNLLRQDAASEIGSREDGNGDRAVVRWSVETAQAQWLPKIDAMALDCLALNAWRERRWLRFAPRYMGRLAHGVRVLRCDPETCARFTERLRDSAERGELKVGVTVDVEHDGLRKSHSFLPMKG